LDLLEDAVREVNRIEGNKPDRALLFVGIANQFIAIDRVRAWEIMGEVVKDANRLDGFENYSLTSVFRALAKEDLYRAVEVAKSFKYDAPRSTVTLAIASSILDRNNKISTGLAR